MRARFRRTCRSRSRGSSAARSRPGVGAVWRTAGVRPGDRVAIVGCGGVGLSALLGAVAAGAASIVAVDTVQAKLDLARELGATDAVLWAGSPRRPPRPLSRPRAAASTTRSRRPAVRRPCVAAFLSTRTRGAAVLIGIPRADAVLELPALSIPRKERRVLGSLYGSSCPERDFPLILDLYRRGRLPLDKLISHRLPLDEIDRAFELLHGGEPARVVLDLELGVSDSRRARRPDRRGLGRCQPERCAPQRRARAARQPDRRRRGEHARPPGPGHTPVLVWSAPTSRATSRSSRRR